MTTSTQNRATTGKLLAIAFLLAAIAASLMMAAKPAHASTTFTVNSTADHADAILGVDGCFTGFTVDGAGGAKVPECTLRAALNEANYTPGADTINFAIPGSGVKTIAPESDLPNITEAVTINGYSQPGAKPNTKAVGSDAVLKIELSGAQFSGSGLQIGAANTTLKGLVINNWNSAGIRIDGSGATGNRVTGNFIGTDASGTQKLGNEQGIRVHYGSNNTIGGTTLAERNVISGNANSGVSIGDAGVTESNRVIGNYIGTDNTGTKALGNSLYGVSIEDAPGTTVGGTQAGARNVISGNGLEGVSIRGDGATGNRVLSNSIFSNAGLGIDLGDDGPTANDPGDVDTGPNNLQNRPVLSSAKKSATGTTTVRGTLNSTPDKTFNVQFFSNPEGANEGKTLLGSKSVTTNGTGNVSLSFSTKKAIRLGQNITATATGKGGTSEFSASRKVVAQ